MAQTFTGTISLGLSLKMNGGVDIGTAVQTIDTTFQNIFANGTGANQANQMFSDNRTLAGAAVDNLDLYGGLTNMFGTTLNFTSIKGMIIVADSANNDTLVLGGNLTPFASFLGSATDLIIIPPGGMFMLTNPNATGFTVTDTSADVLTITNSDATLDAIYDIIIIGEV